MRGTSQISLLGWSPPDGGHARSPRGGGERLFPHTSTRYVGAARARHRGSIRVKRMLPTVAKWTSVRHVLFGKILEKTSTMFWYDEALAYPRNWHCRFLSFVGLAVPREAVHDAAESATTGGRILASFPTSSMNKNLDLNKHQQGGEDATGATTMSSMNKSFRDELEEATLGRMEEVFRLWLHPDLLKRFGVSSRWIFRGYLKGYLGMLLKVIAVYIYHVGLVMIALPDWTLTTRRGTSPPSSYDNSRAATPETRW